VVLGAEHSTATATGAERRRWGAQLDQWTCTAIPASALRRGAPENDAQRSSPGGVAAPRKERRADNLESGVRRTPVVALAAGRK
jgi:hypothetical protein